MSAGADTSLGARIALWGGREIVALILVSLVAGFATTPYAAYHFHRLAPYGVIANLLAMPVVSVWVMPMGILGVLAHAVRLRRLFWRLMGDGIDWMIAVALWVRACPARSAAWRRSAPDRCCSARPGSSCSACCKTPLRWVGAASDRCRQRSGRCGRRSPMCWSPPTASAVAVRGADGRLAMVQDPAATPSRRANGLPPTPMRARRRTRRWARAFAATRRLHRHGSPTARLVAIAERDRRLRGGLPPRRARGQRRAMRRPTAPRW